MVDQLCLSCGAFCDPLYITCPECGSYNLITEDEYDRITGYDEYIQSIQDDLAYNQSEDDNE